MCVFLLLGSTMKSLAQVPAFPGADGYGRYTSGGRGGSVYYVTTLEDSEEYGTLRYGVTKLSKATILFKISGTIHLKSQLNITGGDLTIAGQSAPGDGICIAEYPVMVSSSNVIIRYIRCRMGDLSLSADEADGGDAMGGRFCNNVIIDHCSISWSTDETCSFYANTNFTMQWCLVTESLRESLHSKGAHGYGGIWGGMGGSFLHNMMAHHGSRTPRWGTGNHQDHPELHVNDMRNCVFYNWAGLGCYGAEGMQINIVNNYYKPGPGTNKSQTRIIAPGYATLSDGTAKWGKFYINGNVNVSYSEITDNNWKGVTWSNDSSIEGGTVTESDLKSETEIGNIPLYHQHSADEAYRRVTSYVGCSKSRDEIDERIINECLTSTATYSGSKSKQPGIIDSVNDLKPEDAGEDWEPWPTLASTTPPIDSDADGMPDTWENQNGLDSSNPEDRNLRNEEGYTMLEVYLASLVADITQSQYENSEVRGEEGEAYDPNEISTDATIFWPMGTQTEEQSASISNTEIVSGTGFEMGEGLVFNGSTLNVWDITFSMFSPATESSSTPTADGYIAFNIDLPEGIRVKPSEINFDACRHGTNGTSIDVAWVDNAGNETSLLKGAKGTRNSEDASVYKPISIDMSDIKLDYTETKGQLKMYLYNCATNKRIGIANVNIGLHVEETNGIETLSVPVSQSTITYNMFGQRVNTDAHGIQIIEGRKVLK